MIRRTAIALVLAATFAACRSESNEGPVLARVAGQAIDAGTFRADYVDYLASTGLPDTPVRREAFLNRMVSVRLMVADAREVGLDATDAFREARERARRKLLIEGFLADNAYDTIEVSTGDLEALFVRANTEISARHLFATTEASAQRLRARLDAGESFEALARETFGDPDLAASGGSVGTFGFDEMDPAFEDAAYVLPIGGISDPVRTAQGWSVIRVDDRHTKPVLTEEEFVQRRPHLADYALRRRKALARSRVADAVLVQAAVDIDETVLDDLVASAAGALVDEADVSAVGARRLVSFDRNGDRVVWSVQDFVRAARFTSDRQRASVGTFQAARYFVEGLVVREIMVDRARRAGLEDDTRFRRGLDRAMDDWLYDRRFEEVADGLQVSDAQLRGHFEAHADAFTLPERRRVREIVVRERAEAIALLNAHRTSSFEDLARRHSVRAASAAGGGDLGLLARDAFGPWGDDVFTAPDGAVLGPFPSGGEWVLLETGTLEPARPAHFEEVRDVVLEQVRLERRRPHLRAHVDSLRGRHSVSVSAASLASMPLRPVPSVSS